MENKKLNEENNDNNSSTLIDLLKAIIAVPVFFVLFLLAIAYGVSFLCTLGVAFISGGQYANDRIYRKSDIERIVKENQVSYESIYNTEELEIDESLSDEELREQLKEELRSEVRAEVKEELRNELLEEESFKEELKSEILEELKNDSNVSDNN